MFDLTYFHPQSPDPPHPPPAASRTSHGIQSPAYSAQKQSEKTRPSPAPTF